MAIVGTYLILWLAHPPSGGAEALAWFGVGFRIALIVIFASNFLWLPVGVAFAKSRPKLSTALLIGAISPLLGCLLLGSFFGFAIFAKLFYFLVPVGMVTGYLVRRVTLGATDRSSPPA
jgi:hypothetical protein